MRPLQNAPFRPVGTFFTDQLFKQHCDIIAVFSGKFWCFHGSFNTLIKEWQSNNFYLIHRETFEKCSILLKFKEGDQILNQV